MDIEKTLLKLCTKAYKKGEVPVGCVIVYKDKIISKSYNQRHKKKNPIMHAEIVSILKASKRIKDWRLTDCELYVTLHPCDMCCEVIKEARISKVYYYLDQENSKMYKEFKKINNNYNEKFKNILTDFFKIKR